MANDPNRCYIHTMATWNYRDNEILADYHATEDELIQTTKTLNLNRRQIYDAFVEVYIQLSKSLNDKEWVASAKIMKSLL